MKGTNDRVSSMRTRRSILLRWLLTILLLAAAAPAVAAEGIRYREGRSGKGELKYVNDLPVLVLEGTPEEMGRQQAALVAETAKGLMSYPQDLLGQIGLRGQWPDFVKKGMALVPHFPPRHLAELDAFAEATGFDRGELIGTNTMVDMYRGGFGCSSLIVAPKRSKTGGALFGRNLDFFTLGKLQRYSLVIVCRPEGRHAFVSVGFPGFFGCLTGMNDAGLALAVHEVYLSRDGSSIFNSEGTPYILACRRILEECTTVEQADKMLRSIKRTTKLNLAVCDRRGGGVLEMTPRTVVFRREEDGVCACTNHFRTEALKVRPRCPRYDKLLKAKAMAEIGLADVARKLHEVNQGRLTLQTMVFEPGPLRLHLAIGSCPASALPLKPLELAPLLRTRAAEKSR